MRNQQSGFTLVEIAIVLVIIGLLLGGVLKGQELINQAKIKNIANDLNGLSAAIYAYQDRYRAFPGDDRGAALRWTAPLAIAGDGNASVGAANNANVIDCSAAPGNATENCNFWQHLRLSGFIAGDTATVLAPQNAVGGTLHVQAGALGLAGLVMCTTNLLGRVANAIDAQFDDGNPATGQVRGIAGAAGVYVLNAAPANAVPTNAYIDDNATLYTVCKAL
jgi:prepilin-type N-terminal cleavage/methylation domain-containing protein